MRKILGLLTPALRWFLFAMILANIASEMFYSLLPLYLREMGTTVEQIGTLFSLAAVVMLALQLAGGWISDTIGRLRAVALGGLVACSGYILIIFAHSWPVALVAICLEYVSGCLVAPSYGAFLSEQSSDETRGRVFGISDTLFMVVVIVGPPLGGFLAYRYGFRLMLSVSAAIYITAALLRLWMARRFAPAAYTAERSLSWAGFRGQLGQMVALVLAGGLVTWILITDGMRDVAYRMSIDMYSLYFRDVGGLNLAQIGWLGSLSGVANMLAMLPSGWITDRRGPRVAMILGMCLEIAGFAVFVNVRTIAGFGLANVIANLGVGMLVPAFDTLVSKAVPERMRGIAFGLFQSSVGVVSLAAPWLGGQLYARISPRTPFIFTGLILLVNLIPVWLKLKLPREEKPLPAVDQAQ